MGRSLKKGSGWRLGWDPDPTCPFQGLVGADTWAMELTAEEFGDFCRLLIQLANTVAAIAPELMSEETITCAAESDLVWLEITGYPYLFDLRLLILQGRNGEGNWDANAVQALLPVVRGFHATGELPL